MAANTGEGLLCILFTDVVGWTELGERVGDDVADPMRRDHFAAIRAALRDHRGREVKTAGDSVLATFRSALEAMRCAAAIQADADPGGLQVRVGVHAGEPIAEDDDIFGTAVNVASRLCSAAAPGDVVVSDLVRSLVGSRGGFTFESTGPLRLKGIRAPMPGFRLRVSEPSPPPAPPPTPAAAPARTSAPLRPVQAFVCPVVVGRERELGALARRLAATVDGRGGVIALVGDAGVGKTRLCREAARLAGESGVRVLFGRAVPGHTPVPYRPLTEALLAAVRDSGPPDAPELAGFEGHLGRLVPAWRTGAPGGADESPVLLAEAVLRLLRVLGEGEGHAGALVMLEDLHWADAETLEVVDYLADALAQERTLVVCTSRPTGAATQVLARMQRRDPKSVVGVTPLAGAEVDDVVAACLATDDPPRDVLAVVGSHSEGNPFLVEELLAGLVASHALTFEDGVWTTSDELQPSVPFSFGDSIRERLAAVGATDRRVVSAAAVLGRHFDWELLPGVAELDGRAIVDGLRRAVDEQLLEVDGNGFRFRHALTREAVLSELLPPERRELSSRAWPAIERAHPGLPGPWCELAAELAEASGDLSQAAVRLVESAARALAGGALTSAESTARRAIRLAAGDGTVADDATEVLVETLALAGKPDQAAALGTALVERLAAEGAPARRQAALLVVLARAAIAAGDHAAAHTTAARARELVDQGDLDDAMAARVEAVAAHVALDDARLEEAEALARSAMERAAATGQPAVECEAIEVIGRVVRTRQRSTGKEWFERAASLAERNGLTGWLLRACQELALDDWANGRTQPLAEVRELAARHGALVTVAVMDLALADFALGSFDRAGCLEAAQRCVDGSRRYGLATLPVAELWLAGAHALFGDEDAMEAAGARALERDPDDPRILGDLWGRVRAVLAIVRDDRAALRTALDRQMDYARVAPVTTSIFPNRILWALVHTVDDDDHGEAARAEVAAASNLAIWPQVQADMEMMAAIADGRAGRTDAATTRFAAASAELWTSQLAVGTVAYHHLLVAEAAIRDGWGDPASWLRRSEAFFADAGYDVLARVCRSLLVKAGAPAPRRGRGDSVVPPAWRALGITSREVDVLVLVAEGLSNREIADRLSLSPKTVERHLASLFDRTGIRNRKDLGDFARTQTA